MCSVTTFQICSDNLQIIFNKPNSELQKAAMWFQSTKLTLNVPKTKFILFRSKNIKVNFDNLNLEIGNKKIERIGSECKNKSFKFVVHHLDEFLTWNFQINTTLRHQIPLKSHFEP